MFAGVFDEVFGVPTHPLAVHAPIVLIPLLTIVSIGVLFRSRWRSAAAVPLAVASLVMVALLFAAKESGQAADSANNVFGDIGRHKALAETTFILAIVWFVVAALAALVRVVRRRPSAQPLSAGVADRSDHRVVFVLDVIVAVAAIVTTVWLVRTGHAGSESRWKI